MSVFNNQSNNTYFTESFCNEFEYDDPSEHTQSGPFDDSFDTSLDISVDISIESSNNYCNHPNVTYPRTKNRYCKMSSIFLKECCSKCKKHCNCY